MSSWDCSSAPRPYLLSGRQVYDGSGQGQRRQANVYTAGQSLAEWVGDKTLGRHEINFGDPIVVCIHQQSVKFIVENTGEGRDGIGVAGIAKGYPIRRRRHRTIAVSNGTDVRWPKKRRGGKFLDCDTASRWLGREEHVVASFLGADWNSNREHG